MSLQVAPVCDGRFGRSIPSQEEGRKEGRRKPFVEQIKRRAAGGDADTRPATSIGDQDEAFGELVSCVHFMWRISQKYAVWEISFYSQYDITQTVCGMLQFPV